MGGTGRNARGIRGAFRGALAATALLSPASVSAQPSEIAEFQARQTVQFSSRGHEKARGLNVTLRYPRSWRAEEGDRPHVLQNFLATNGSGSNCNILIRDGGGATAAELRQAIRPENAPNVVPRSMTLVAAQATTLDNQQAVEIQVRQSVNRGGVAVEARMVMFMAVYRDSLVNLTCGTGAPTAQDAELRYRAYLPLFRRVAGSVIFQDQYR